VDAEVAAVGGAGQVLPAHVAEERPDVVPLHELVPWVGEVANEPPVLCKAKNTITPCSLVPVETGVAL
jgi:hypothetical protein